MTRAGEAVRSSPAACSAAAMFTLRAENLLGADYEEAWGFPAPGRGVYLGGSVALGGR